MKQANINVSLDMVRLVDELAEYQSYADIKGLIYGPESPFFVTRTKRDPFARDVSGGWQATNAIYPFRPIIDGKVIKTSKINVKLKYHPNWWGYIISLIGRENASEFDNSGDGNQDLNDPGLDVDNWSADRKHMPATYSGNLLRVSNTIYRDNLPYYVVDHFHEEFEPYIENGKFLIDGQEYTWEEYPHLYATRSLITSRDIHACWQTPTDCKLKAHKGVDGKGTEHWPLISNELPCIEGWLTEPYLRPPFHMLLYKNSIIQDGVIVPQQGVRVNIVQLAFRGNDVFGQEEITQRWYLLETLDVRGSEADKTLYGDEYDWRIFASWTIIPDFPYRTEVCAPSPDAGWTRRT